MKRVIFAFLAFIMIFSFSIACADVDISGLSFNELATLVNKAQMLMMQSDKWQEVEVPPGTYLVGKDIPAGHWTLYVYDESYVNFEIGTSIKENGEIDVLQSLDLYKNIVIKGPKNILYSEGDTTSYSIELKDDWYIVITSGSIIFKPYSGNSFTFK